MILLRYRLNFVALLVTLIGCIAGSGAARADTSVPACFEAPSRGCLLDTADEAITAIQDSATRAFFFANLALQETTSGLPAKAHTHFSTALSASGEIESPEARFAALSHIANRQEDAGLFLDAQHTLAQAGQLVAAQIATVGMNEAATWRHRQGDLESEQARINAKSATVERERRASADTAKRQDPLERLFEGTVTASRQMNAGDRIGTIETLAAATLDANWLTDPEQQLSAWLEIGRLRLALGQCEGAKLAANNALTAFRHLPDNVNRPNWTAALTLFLHQLASGQ